MLAKPTIVAIVAASAKAAAVASTKAKPNAGRRGLAATCTGIQASGRATLTVAAGTAQVEVNAKGKVKAIGAPLGVWLDILPAGAAANATANAACHIRVAGRIKAGATRARAVAANKLTACYAALKLADCITPLQARVTAAVGKKYKQGLASKVVVFTPACVPCIG
jgi:hypothetical protein